MRCLYCGGPIVESKGLTESEFCSKDHQFRYEGVSRLGCHEHLLALEPPDPVVSHAVLLAIRSNIERATPVCPRKPELSPTPELPGLSAVDQLCSLSGVWSFEPAAPVDATHPEYKFENSPTPPQLPVLRVEPKKYGAKSYNSIRVIWNRIPVYVKPVAVIVPLLFGVACMGGFRAHDSRGFRILQSTLAKQWATLGAQIRNRAAIDFTDDFRTGLDQWRGRSNAPANWSYDAAGFVRPGPLAIYHPTVALADYRFEFVAQIGSKEMGFVFRAPDASNFYAVEFAVAQSGPLPVVQMVRYAVIQRREGPRVIRRLPIAVRNDMWYRVRLDATGHDFTLIIQDQIVDYWSDSRLKQGGVGFFCGQGERARLRSVEVSHQHDALGKVCAYLAQAVIK